MVRDMTHGSPVKLLLGFWFPLLLGNLFQQVYNLADSVIVGRFVGVRAFAGVSATGSLNFLIIGLLLGLCSGCAIPVAQAFGENDPHRMRQYFANALYLCGGIAAVMSVVTALLARPILHWIGTPEDILDESYSYIVWIFTGMLATMLCITCLADGRYLGMQIIFVGLAASLLYCCWVMVKNLQKGEAPKKKKKSTGGFESLT